MKECESGKADQPEGINNKRTLPGEAELRKLQEDLSGVKAGNQGAARALERARAWVKAQINAGRK